MITLMLEPEQYEVILTALKIADKNEISWIYKEVRDEIDITK